MNTTAENMCYNLLNLLDTYGHVPNGKSACEKTKMLNTL